MSTSTTTANAKPTDVEVAIGNQVAVTRSGKASLTPLKIVLIMGSILLVATGSFGAGFAVRGSGPTVSTQVTIESDGTGLRGAGILKIEEAAKALVMAGKPNASVSVDVEVVSDGELTEQSINIGIGAIVKADDLPKDAIRYDMNDDGTGKFAMTMGDDDEEIDFECIDSMRCHVEQELTGNLTGSSNQRKLWGSVKRSVSRTVSKVHRGFNKATNGPTRSWGYWFARRPLKWVCWTNRRVCPWFRGPCSIQYNRFCTWIRV